MLLFSKSVTGFQSELTWALPLTARSPVAVAVRWPELAPCAPTNELTVPKPPENVVVHHRREYTLLKTVRTPFYVRKISLALAEANISWDVIFLGKCGSSAHRNDSFLQERSLGRRPTGGSYGAVCMSRFWPSPLLHTADPRRFWRHHQPDLQTFLLEEESRHHVRGPEHQVRPAADWQTGVSPKHVGGVQANAAGAFTDLPHPRYFVCVCCPFRSSVMTRGSFASLCLPLITSSGSPSVCVFTH